MPSVKPNTKKAFAAFAVISASAGAEMTVFQSFAVAATFDQNDWQSFLVQQKNEQSQLNQSPVINRHSNDSYHTNHSNHYNTDNHSNQSPHTNHSNHNDVYGTHTNNHTNQAAVHTNNTPHNNGHNNYGAHDQNPSMHIDGPIMGHDNTYGHMNNGVGSGHYNESNIVTGHCNEYAHWNKYNQTNTHTDQPGAHTDSMTPYGQAHGNSQPHTDVTPYTQYTQHANSGSHDNTWPYSQYNQHSNGGFDHDNYVPTKPKFFNVSENRIVGGMLKIGLYSYDKNQDGLGTQSAQAREVAYDVTIQKIKNIDGTSATSSVRTLASNVKETLMGQGLLVDLNTLDPLGVGNSNPANSNGYYTITAVARNTVSGVNFNSQSQSVTIIINQNRAPQMTVTNGDEFINFTFGFDGVLAPTGEVKGYGALYADTDKQDGLFVRVSMTDPDNATDTVQNWQKARVYLKNAAGTVLASTYADVIWDNSGTTVTSSQASAVTGYAYIPKGTFTATDLVAAVLNVEVTDYTDAACTKAAGSAVTTTTISASNNTKLKIDVDVTKPVVTANNTTYNAWQKGLTLALTYSDAISGMAISEYAISTQNVTPPTSWTPYTTPIVVPQGQYYVWYHAKDRVGNDRVGSFGPYWVDSVAPTATATVTSPSSSQRLITINAADATSGVKQITLPNSVVVTGATASYTVTATGTYNFTITDNAGNSYTLPVVADITAPVVTADITSSGWTSVGNVNLTYTDAHSGVVTKEWQVTNSTVRPTSGWQSYSGTIALPEGAGQYLWYHAVDGQGTEVYGYFGPYNVDRSQPTLSATITRGEGTSATIAVTAADSLSGVKQIKLPDNTVVSGSTASYSVPRSGDYTFTVTDNAGNTRTLTVTVADITAPTVSADQTNYAWTKNNVSVNLTYSDSESGVVTKQYQVSQSSTAPTVWNAYTGTVTMSAEGQNYLWYRAVDAAGNETVGSFGPYRIDKTAPTMTYVLAEPAADTVRIDVSLSDALSGAKQVKLPNGSVVSGNSASYTVTTDGVYTFVVEDHAGNTTTKDVLVEITPLINGLKLVDMVGAPAGRTLPIVLPVSAPLPMKAGYAMGFKTSTKNADQVEVRLYANGQPLPIFTSGGMVTSIVKATGTRAQTDTLLEFWLDPNLSSSTIIDMKVIATRISADGSTKSVVNTLSGYQFGIITGSSRWDATINLTH